jgi:hypothetical protein
MMNASSAVVRIEERLLSAWAKTLDLLAWILWNVTVGLFLMGCALVLFQAALWLRRGAWIPITFKDFLPASFHPWIAQPNDWLGVWKVVTFVSSCSAWWVFMVLAVVFYFAAAAMPAPLADSTTRGSDAET